MFNRASPSPARSIQFFLPLIAELDIQHGLLNTAKMTLCCCCCDKSKKTHIDIDDNGSKPLLAAALASEEKKTTAAGIEDASLSSKDGSVSDLSGDSPEIGHWNTLKHSGGMKISKLIDEEASLEGVAGIFPELKRSDDIGHTTGDLRISKMLSEQPSLTDFHGIVSELALENKSPKEEPGIPYSWQADDADKSAYARKGVKWQDDVSGD